MLVTFSAALCVYSEVTSALEKHQTGGNWVAPLVEADAVPVSQRPEERLKRATELATRTRARLKQDWKVPALPCSDRIVSHVADCLWLTEFQQLGHDHPGILAPPHCQGAIVQRANSVGTLLDGAEAD
jgi:hypothetical protein